MSAYCGILGTVSERNWGRSEAHDWNAGARDLAHRCLSTLRDPTYRENSHANHTWHRHSYQSRCFRGSEAPPVWVRFPSPAPFLVVWRLPALS
jgi:hypothetical protein